MRKTHQLYPELVRKYGEEDQEIAEKTWPLTIPSGMRLVAILGDKTLGKHQELEVALDITETDRYMRYIDQVRNGKWSSIRMYFITEQLIERCRYLHNP